MKKTNLLLSVVVIGMVFSSCKKDFLDIVPKGNLVASTTNDFDLLLNNPDFYEQLQGGGWQAMMLLGDDVSAEESSFATTPVESQRLFRWEDVIYQPTGTARDLTVNLGNLYALNKTINEIDAASGDIRQKTLLKAEAKAMRAFTYFQFVNYYTKPYDPRTAGTDPGFPVITEANALANSFDRGTVQADFDFMLRDLNESISVLPLTPKSPIRMSKPAAEAILAKVYLFMGKYSDALAQLNNAFSHLAGSAVRLYDYNVEFAPDGSFMPIGPMGPSSPGNNPNDFTESVLSRTFYSGEYNGNGFGNDGLVLSAKAAALYTSSDQRLNLYSATTQSGAPNPSGRLRKFGLQYVKYGVELSEMYLLRAECKDRLNDLAGAKADVETLRKKRVSAAEAAVPPAVAGDQRALLNFILDERVREYAFGGYRWFDMRRLSVDPLFAQNTYTHLLYLINGAPTATSVFTLRPERLVLRFPETIIVSNPGLKNNP